VFYKRGQKRAKLVYANIMQDLNFGNDFDMNDNVTINCPECGLEMKKKASKNGHFMGCTGYPKCKFTM
jgi:ssDNA-binding Zn-finger/Zn-ribbon topoisomerase 1